MIIAFRKHIIVVSLILISGLIVFFTLQNRDNVPKEVVDNKVPEEQRYGKQYGNYSGPGIYVKKKQDYLIPFINENTRESILSDIEITKGEGYERYSIMANGPKDKIMLAYQVQYSEKSKNGIMVIYLDERGNPEVLWEVQSAMMTSGPGNRFEVRDINNDGVNEILSWWLTVSNIPYENLLLFTWNGSEYILMNPVRNILNIFPGGTDAIITNIDLNSYPSIYDVGENKFFGRKVSVTDIDNDQIDEVIIEVNDPPEEGFDPELGISVYVPLGPNRLITTYKWNGKEFFLWKEERKTVPIE